MRSALSEQKMARTNDFRVLVVMAAAALAAALLILVTASKSAQAAFPGPNGLIVFTSDRDSITDADGNVLQLNDDIYATNSEGSNTVRLTSDLKVEQWPALSPNGTKVAFQSWPSGPEFFSGSEIYRMDVAFEDEDGNGDNRIQLTKNSAFDGEPDWSPDGSKIAFFSTRDLNSSGNPDFEIYVMDSEDSDGDNNGDEPQRLTTRGGFDGLPAWSPNGSQIAFVSRRDGDADIYVMDAKDKDEDGNGDTLINLTNNTVQDSFGPGTFFNTLNSPLAFSPDGSKIAFQRWESDGSIDIYVMDLTVDKNTGKVTGASPPNHLTSTPGVDERYAAWSPDGTKIAFYSGTGFAGYVNSDIWVMNADNGSGKKDITYNPKHLEWGDIQADWGPLTVKQCNDHFVAGVTSQRYPIYEVLGFASEDACRSAAEAGS